MPPNATKAIKTNYQIWKKTQLGKKLKWKTKKLPNVYIAITNSARVSDHMQAALFLRQLCVCYIRARDDPVIRV